MAGKKKATSKKAAPKTGTTKKATSTTANGLTAIMAQLHDLKPSVARVGGREVVTYKLPPWNKPQIAWVAVRDGVGVATKAVAEVPPKELDAVLSTRVELRPGVVTVQRTPLGRFDGVLAFMASDLGWPPDPPGLQVYWAFPCYRCEIPTGMPVEEFKFMLSKGAGFHDRLLAWDRAPEPFLRVRCSSREAPSPVRRFRKELSVGRFDYEAAMLEQCTPEGVVMEFGNVEGKTMTFRGHSRGLQIGNGPTVIPRSAAADALRSFLMGGA